MFVVHVSSECSGESVQTPEPSLLENVTSTKFPYAGYGYMYHSCIDPITPFVHVLMDSTFCFDTINLGWPIVYIEGSHFIL